MKTPLTLARLRHHLAYSWWKYVLLAAIALLGWNIIYTTTAYRPPQEKIVDIYVYGYGDQNALDAYLDAIRADEMSDMEEMRSIYVAPDETYGPMILMAHVAAGEGDLYLFDKSSYQSYASQSVFVPLDDLPQVAAFEETHKTALERAVRRSEETGERHLYGLPLSCAPGFSQYVNGPLSDWYLCVAANGGNLDNAFKLFDIMLRDLTEAPAAAAE